MPEEDDLVKVHTRHVRDSRKEQVAVAGSEKNVTKYISWIFSSDLKARLPPDGEIFDVAGAGLILEGKDLGQRGNHVVTGPA